MQRLTCHICKPQALAPFVEMDHRCISRCDDVWAGKYSEEAVAEFYQMAIKK